MTAWEGWKRRITKRLGLSVLAAALLLAAMEIALRIGASVVARTASRRAATDLTAPAILCVGDSHTYGVGAGPDETYPAQLQAKLAKRGYRTSVVNLGAPGSNTSEIRRSLPQWLRSYTPVAVVVLASVNNCWNDKDADWSDAQEGLPVPCGRRVGIWMQTHSRVVRAVSLLLRGWHRQARDSVEISETREGDRVLHSQNALWDRPEERRRLTIEGMYRALRDLTAIVKLTSEAKAIPILLTYVAKTDDNFSDQNMALRSVAKEMRVMLVDNDRIIRAAFTAADGLVDEEKAGGIFHPDLHLAAGGYSRVSDNIANALAQSGILGKPGGESVQQDASTASVTPRGAGGSGRARRRAR